jgi:hypothetical protein
MAGTLPLDAESDTLTAMIANWLGASYAHLYASDVAIGPNTHLAALLAAEATFAGYAAVLLNSWSAVTIDTTNAAVSTTTLARFTPTAAAGSGPLYGYFLCNSTGFAFYGVERFAGAPITVNQSVTLEVDITYSDITRF